MLETLIKLNSSRAGHDKILRTLQYSCRLILASGSKTERLSSILAHISSSRKFLRLGTCVDALYSSFSSVSNPDPVVRFLVRLSRIAGAMFLFSDHLIWCNNFKLFTINYRLWANISDKCWLYSVILSLSRDLYELNLIFENLYKDPDVAWLINNRPGLVLDTVKNMTDLFLPLAALGKKFDGKIIFMMTMIVQCSGYFKAPGLVAFCGIISSVSAALQIIKPKLKL